MPVIKGGGRRVRGPDDAPIDVEGGSEIDRRAAAIIQDAEDAAAAILAETEEECRALIAEAVELGQREGFSQAEHQRAEVAGLEDRMIKEVDGEVVRTSLNIARALLDAELTSRSDAVVDIVVAALVHVSDAREVFLRVNPENAAVLRKHKRRLVDALSVAPDVVVREDRNVRPGGVLIQTESGVIDATLETQLAEIARVLGA